MKYPLIHLACNDYRNGNFEGKLRAVHVSLSTETLLDLPSVYLDRFLTVDIDLKLSRIKVSRQYFAIKSHKSWYGNWCWDVVAMHPKTAADFLNFIKSTKHFTCDGGVVSPVDWDGTWTDEARKFSEEMFEREMAELQKAEFGK